MISCQTDQQQKIYFYSPGKSKRHYFRQDQREEVVAFGNTLLINWIASTYIELQKAGLCCEVIEHLPKQGIVLADRDSLGNRHPYLNSSFLVCVKGDKEFHPSAHTHIVQNTIDTKDPSQSLWNPFYIPHWPQPGLKPRQQKRGSTVKNVAFIGSPFNLLKEFKSDQWISGLKQLGCEWTPIFSPTQWSDYSEIDVIVAIRSFDGKTYPHKPASKLVNAWKAGVPAILTPESAFVELRKSELDFLMVNSLEEAINSVEKLKNSPELYKLMVNNGLKRSQEFSDEKITQYWLNFFHDHVFPEYAKWMEMSETSKILMFMKRYSRLKTDRLRKRVFGNPHK